MKRLILPILTLFLMLCSCVVQRQAEPKRYDTLSQKANLTLEFDQHQYTIGSTIQLWQNELIIFSLQPVVGLEVVRIEATPDSVLLVDKMNRQYTTLTYDSYETLITPEPSFKMIQQFVTTPTKNSQKPQSKQSFSVGKHRIGIGGTFTQREYNTLGSPRRINLKKFKQVSLRDILPL